MQTEIVTKDKTTQRKKYHKSNLQLSLSQLLQTKSNKEKKTKDQKRIFKILFDPRSIISLYNGKAPTMKYALKQIMPKNLTYLLLDNKQFKYICSNFNKIFPRLNFNNTNIKNYNLRDPYKKPPEYDYQVIKFTKNNCITLKPVPDVTGFVDDNIFNKCLTIYENNQQYYINNVIEYDYDIWQTEITNLEQWFIEIIEPIKNGKQYKYWYQRECEKYNGASFYCNELLVSDLLELEFRYLIHFHKQI